MRTVLSTLIVAILFAVNTVLADQIAEPLALEFRGRTYVSMEALAKAVGGKLTFTRTDQALGVQPLELRIGSNSWQFINGGDSVVVSPGSREIPLVFPVLVYKEHHYVAVEEFAKFSSVVVDKAGEKPTITIDGHSLPLTSTKFESKYLTHQVGPIRKTHRVVTTLDKLVVRRSLYKANDTKEFPKGSVLLVRRTVEVDGKALLIVTDCDADFVSYLADSSEVDKKTAEGSLNATRWAATRKWFDKQSVDGSGLRNGNRENLAKSICLTVDLCWSLRPIETDLFRSIREAAEIRKGGVAVVLFMNGRWIEQQPGEMEEMINLALLEGVHLTWGVHSYAHPKYGVFLNSFTRDQIRDDTLRVEKQLLEWGVVPSVFYRFPGLVHDRERIEMVLDLDLFPIDANAWLAITEQEKNKEKKSPFAQPVTDGSIVLVHGNGNEPQGIHLLLKWLELYQDWELAPLYRFMPFPNQ